MTTTAHEDQFTAEPEPVRHPYDTGSILRRNVADLEIALRKHTAKQADCRTCANRGKVNGLSQESFCDSCIWQGMSWRKDHHAPVVTASDTIDLTTDVPAPAVPAGCVAHLAQLADDPCQCHCCRTKRRKARALLQSAEVTK